MTPLSSSSFAAAMDGGGGSSPFSPHWALHPRSYLVQRAPPTGFTLDDLDGDLTKDAWKDVPFSEAFGDIQGKDDAPNPPPYPVALTRFKAMYDDTHLYIGAMVHPSQDFETQAHFTERNSPIFQLDSDYEVFIDVHSSTHNYKELEVNALNTVWNLLLNKPYEDDGYEHSGRIAQPGDDDYYEVYQQKTAVRVLEGELNDPNGVGALWSVEMALAYTDLFNDSNQRPSFLVPTPKPGAMWRINFSRVELQGEVNWTWQPQRVWDPKTKRYEGKINMHLPDAWGYFVFGGDDENAAPNRSSTSTVEPQRDASWPWRLTAMNVYYAQRVYQERHGKYACRLSQLQNDDLVDPAIVAPFTVTISIVGDDVQDSEKIKASSIYTAKVEIKQEHDEEQVTTSTATTTTSSPLYATVNNERLLQVVWSKDAAERLS